MLFIFVFMIYILSQSVIHTLYADKVLTIAQHGLNAFLCCKHYVLLPYALARTCQGGIT